jgi:prepilin-type N-terminal cleavage/methylation domain-containing protein
MDSTRTAERGFTLIELLICVAVLAAAGAAALGACAAVARNATPGIARDAALAAGENALARARAATAYATSPAQDGTAPPPDDSWALVPGETRYTAGARLRATALCGATAPLLIRMPVVADYDAAGARFTVVVTYPRDPCRVAADGTIPADDAATVTLAQTLPPPVYPPGQTVHRDVAAPARM